MEWLTCVEQVSSWFLMPCNSRAESQVELGFRYHATYRWHFLSLGVASGRLVDPGQVCLALQFFASSPQRLEDCRHYSPSFSGIWSSVPGG